MADDRENQKSTSPIQAESQTSSIRRVFRVLKVILKWTFVPLIGVFTFVWQTGIATPIVQDVLSPITDPIAAFIGDIFQIEQATEAGPAAALATRPPGSRQGSVSATPTPTDVETCVLAPPPQLALGDSAMQVGAPSVRMRDGPGLGALVIGRLQRQEVVLVVNGPRCADGFYWFKVVTGGHVEGWVAEADYRGDREYWLVGASPFTDVPAPSVMPSATDTVTPHPSDTPTPSDSVTPSDAPRPSKPPTVVDNDTPAAAPSTSTVATAAPTAARTDEPATAEPISATLTDAFTSPHSAAPSLTSTHAPAPSATPVAAHTATPCQFSPAPQLQPGDTAIQLGAASVRLRSEPGLNADVIKRIRRNDRVRIASERRCVDEHYWYRVVTGSNEEGWLAEADNNTKLYWLVRASDDATCALEPRLAPGDTARSKPGRALNVREQPQLGSRETARDIAGGESVDVLAGPVCADRFIWYQVRNDALGIAGWVAEGGASGYWFYAPERLR